MSARDRLIVLVTLALGVTAATACSLRYNFTECENDAECRALEDPSSGVFYTCTSGNRCATVDIDCRSDDHCDGENNRCRNNRCVSPSRDAGGRDTRTADATEDVTGDAMSRMDADTVATDVSPDGASTDTVDRTCDTTLECRERFGEDYVCAPARSCEGDGGDTCGSATCLRATNDLCPTLFYPSGLSKEDFEDVVLLGSIVPESGPLKSVGTTLTNAIQLAVREWQGQARGIPSGETVAWLQCDNSAKRSASIRAAEHLARVGAPAIVGPIRSGNYLDVVEKVTGDANIVTIAPAATAPSISKALSAAGEYSFRIIGNDQFQARALLDRLKTLLTHEDSNDIEVTVFYKNDRYGKDFQNQIGNAIGEADWIENGDVRFLKTLDPVTNTQSAVEANVGTKVSEALGQQPGADVVAFIGTGGMIPLAATYIEAAFANGSPEANPETKRYVFSHGAVPSLPDLPSELGGNETFVPLTEGVSPNVIDRDNFPAFRTRYNTIFNEELTANSAGIAYDGAIMAMLAMAGVPADEPITGETVAEVIRSGELQDQDAPRDRRISLGDPVNIGIAAKMLGDGKTIDITGVSGGLDLNDQGNVRPNYIGIDTGIKLDLNGDPVYDILPTRLWQVDKAPKLTGTWTSLPPSFTPSSGVIKPKVPQTPGIPDNDPDGLTSTVSVASNECSTTTSLGIELNVEHPKPEELKVTITSPATDDNGNPIEVLLREDGNKSVPLQGVFPETLLPAPSGTDYATLLAARANGDWTLTVTDTAAGNTGQLKRWSLKMFCN